MWTILKALIELLQYCFYFMFCFFDHETCGILAPWPAIKHAAPVLENKVLTAGPPGKSLFLLDSYLSLFSVTELLSIVLLTPFFH